MSKRSKKSQSEFTSLDVKQMAKEFEKCQKEFEKREHESEARETLLKDKMEKQRKTIDFLCAQLREFREKLDAATSELKEARAGSSSKASISSIDSDASLKVQL